LNDAVSERALRDTHRVLRPGGHALFVEPLRGNPVAKLVQALTPEARTADESPLSGAQIRFGNELFGSSEHFFANLLSVPAGVVSSLTARTPDNAGMRIFVLSWEKRHEN